MPIPLTPALLIGLGLRILLDNLTRTGEAASIRDFALLGVWQGVAFHYSLKYPNLSILLAAFILGKLFLEHSFLQDTTRTVTTLCGVVLGVISSEMLSQLFDPRTDPKVDPSARKRRLSTAVPPPRKDRAVQFEPGRHPNRSRGGVGREIPVPTVPHPVSDITSVESSSEFLGSSSSLSPRERLEREIKMLRTRASLADSERRRFKEERKWATSAGNEARADQMKWQVKRYAALMQSFHREADIKLLEASTLPRDEPSQSPPKVSSQQKSTPQQPRRWKEPTPEPQNGSPGHFTDPGPNSSRRKSTKITRELIR